MSDDVFYGFPGYMGWVPDEVDDRDRMYDLTFRVPWGSESYLRTTKDYENYWNEVYDQGSTSSCTANAVSAAYAFESNRSKDIEAKTKKAFLPSRSFIYYNARRGEPENNDVDDEKELIADDGSQIRLAMRSLQKFGVCKEVSWPLRSETVKWYPGPYAFYEAQKYMIRSYQYKRLDVKRGDKDRNAIISKQDVQTMDKDGDTVLFNLRSCLSQGSPVIFGFRLYTVKNEAGNNVIDWRQSKNSAITKWYLPDVPKARRHYGPEVQAGGHAVLAVGFLDQKKNNRTGWVLCQNSWGSDEDDPGCPFFWMPYSYITDFSATMDFWMMDFLSFPSKL